MNCVNHPDRSAVDQCTNCQVMLCQDCQRTGAGKAIVCIKCEALLASRLTSADLAQERTEARQRQEQSEQEKAKKKRQVLMVQLAIIAVAVVVVAIRFPAIKASLEPEQPLRIGSYDTDAVADECIATLWRAVPVLQAGERPGAELSCPQSGAFEIFVEDDDLIARVPNPEVYGFREMRVSRKQPVPEVIK